jgi:hypothetical protein
MNKLNLSYSILILGILVNICWLLSEYKTNSFIIESVHALENNTQGYLEYKDNQTRIEFQYPENWYINQLRLNMILITPFSDYNLSSFHDYYFDYIEFNNLKSELQKRSETLNNLSLGLESLLGFNKTNSTFNKSILDGISIPGEYEQIQPLTIDNHTAFKIIRPQAIHIALEIEDTQLSNQVFHMIIFVQNTKDIDQLIKNEMEKIISSIKISDPFVIENSISIGKKLVHHNELQNISIHTRDKNYNKTLPYTNASIKITYPSGFELDIPNASATDENGRLYYEWTIPENVVSGKYVISVTTDKENYTGSTASNFFYVGYKEKIPLKVEVTNMDISYPLYQKQFTIDFKLINPTREKITINQINYSVAWAGLDLFSSESDKILPKINNGDEIISISNIFENSEIPIKMKSIWDSMSDVTSRGLYDFKINGTFSYNPYPDLVDIENKEEFNFHYAVNKFE